MSMKKILLIRPNSTGDKRDTYITFPLGIGYVAAILKREGYEVSVMDLTLIDVDYQDLKKKIVSMNPDIIGISALSYSYSQVKYLSKYLKKIIPSKIILGGHLAYYNYEIVLNRTSVDICVIGEGELTIVDLIKNMNNIDSVKGIAYKEKNHVIVNKPRELIENLDIIPFPAYELFDLDKYIKLDDVYLPKMSKNEIHKKMSLEAGRGCPFDCNFCSRTFRSVRKRSIKSIVSEMEFLKERYGVDVFWYQDELLFSNKRYMIEFCKEMKSHNFYWYGNARIDSVDEEIILKAKQSNCLEIAYGVESGSSKILKNMNKKITPEKIEKILSFTIKSKLHMDMGLIIGYPGENDQTIQETVDMFKRIGYPGLKFRYITPYPGSRLYDTCIEEGRIKDEEQYLISLGDGMGPYKFRINFTEYPDDKLRILLKETSNKVFRNYINYLLRHPIKLLGRIFKKDVMNPIYVLYNRSKRATNYDKAIKINETSNK